MTFRTGFVFTVLVSALAVVPGPSAAQSQTAETQSQPAATTAPPQPQAAPIPKAKPSKVWTNDEIDTLGYSHSVSAAGNRTPQNASAKSKAGYSQEKDPAWYRRQLVPLQAEIEKLNGQIAKLQAFLSGENVSDPPTTHRQMVPTPRDQLKQLEAKRAKDVEKVNDLLDRARHNDIAPGELR